MFVRIAHHVDWALACVASGKIFAYRRTMTWMVVTLVDVDAINATIVFETCFATASCLSVTNNARSVWTTVDAITCIFAYKIDTLSVEWTVGVVQTFHLLTASLMIMRVAGKEANFGTLALHLMIHNRTDSTRTTWIVCAQVNAA